MPTPRPVRTVTCPHCGTSRTTKANGGLALRCPGCSEFFPCPPKRPGEEVTPTEKPPAALEEPQEPEELEEPEPLEERVGAPTPRRSTAPAVIDRDGAVTIRRRGSLAVPAAPPPADPDPADEPAPSSSTAAPAAVTPPAPPQAPTPTRPTPRPGRGARSHPRNRRRTRRG